LLHELVPSVRLVAVLLNPNNPNAEADVADAQVAARASAAVYSEHWR